MPGPAIEVPEAKEFAAQLKAAGPEFPKQLTRVHRLIAGEVLGQAELFANGEGPIQSHFAHAMFAAASQTMAAVAVKPQANAAIWGAEKRTGWFADPKYDGLPSNQPEWVGADWEPGGPGGPYGINAAIRHDLPAITAHFDALVDDLSRRAFPD